MMVSRKLFNGLLTVFWLSGSSVVLDAAPVFSLFSERPVLSENVEKSASGFKLGENSRLGFDLAADKLAEQGTFFFAVRPGADFGGKKDTPTILFQAGANHWEPNNITLFRETDGRLLLIFFGEKTRVFQQWDSGALRKGKLNTVAVSYDRDNVRFFLNGRRGSAPKSPVPIRFKPAKLHLGMPAGGKPGWNFSGDITAFEIDDAKLADDVIVDKMKALSDETVAPLTESAPYVRQEKGIVRIGGSKFELQVSGDGMPRALYDKLAKRFVIRDWSLGGNAWWSFDTIEQGKPQSVSSRDFTGIFSTDGKSAVWRYRVADNGSEFTVTVTPAADGTLRFNHALDSRFSQPVKQIYFPQLGGFDKGRESWVLMPWWQGIRRDLKKDFKFMCWGGPGHLSMLLIGLELDDATLFLYPQDPTGHVKFAIADDRNSGPDGAVLINWQNRDWVLPHENYRADYDFVLDNVGNTGMRGIADRYRIWAEKQPWFLTWEEKLKRYPGTRQVLDGIVKMVGFEALGKDGNRYDPDLAGKDRDCVFSYSYDRFIEVAERIESVYRVKPAYRYDGWWGRFDSGYPIYFPVNPRLGDFRKFMEKNNAAHRMVVLHTNPIQYDFDSPAFDIGKQTLSTAGTYQDQVWSRNRLYFSTPRAILEDEVRAVKAMREHGANGIFEDVIGCTTMLDVNPAGRYPYWHRDAGTIAVMELCRALREASGPVFRGTEGGEERRLPYYDGFMMQAGNREENVPFFSMVYGDCFANVVGIEGGGDGGKAIDRARRMLFGMVLGLDGRGDWAKKSYVPSAQMIFETQKVLRSILGQRLLDYRNLPGTKAYVSQWNTGSAIANLGTGSLAVVECDTVIGKVKLESVAPGGSVFLTDSGRFAAWLCRRAELDGKVLFDLGGDAETAIVAHDGAVVIANLGDNPLELKPEVPGLRLTGKFERRPADRFETFKPGDTVGIAPGEVLFLEIKN